MWKPAKRAILQTARKACVLLLAYCMFATSVWSLALPLPSQASARFISYSSSPVGAGHAAMRAPGSAGLRNSALAAPAIKAVNASMKPSYDASSTVPGNCSVHSTHPSHDGNDGDDSYRNYEYDDASSQTAPPAIVASGFTVFGPQTFVRTTGDPDQFDASIAAPAWIVQPFYLHIENGDANGDHRISSAIISIDGNTVLSEAAFSQTVGSIDCAINLTAHSSLHLTLASKPGSFITLNVLGQSADKTAPVMAVTAPANNTAINTATPHIAVSYNDLVGVGEPAASGINIGTLKVLLDGVDLTSLFTKRPDEATADLPSSLALSPGTHNISASIKDNAGNAAHATSQFQVALQGASLQILQPSPGIFTNAGTVPVQLSYSSSAPMNITTLKVLINNVDRTSLFAAAATGATATLNSATVLQQGANQISASVRDTAGNSASASVAFNFDTVAPLIVIEHPAQASTHASPAVEYSIQYSDDQAIDPASLQVAINGSPLAVSPGPASAAGTASLTDGTYTITASIKDKAGNVSTASSTFSVDSTSPNVHIVQPAPGALLNTSSAQVQVQYFDNESLNPQSLKITEDGTDVTSAFTVSASSATATLQPIADGSHTIAAQIADVTGNIGHATTSLLVDTIKPQLTIVSPIGPVNTGTPAALAQYSDSGSGIDPATVHVFLDGSDVTGSFSVGSNSTTGTLGSTSSLVEGPHQFRVKVADRAGNLADTAASFLVDVTAPTVNFSAPANNSFINNTQPDLALNYSDAGSGVNPASIHIFLQQGTAAETEITSLFSIGANQAAGRISAAAPLVEGTYHLRAQIVDNAGNISSAFSAFEVDTTAPSYTVVSPVANGLINTATPAVLVTYQDAGSGVDTSKFALRIDGVDRTGSLALTDKQAAGTLLASDALADGRHTLDVTVVDKAGNAAAQTTQSFLVDTIPPVVNIQTPAASSFINLRQPPVSVVYSDAGSGIDLASFTATVDGVDHTAEFTATAAGATGNLVAALLDGNHIITVTVKDLAGNATTATAAFALDTIPPQITITQPADGAFTNAVSTAVAGSVLDSSPVNVTVEGVAVPLQGNTFTASAVALGAVPSQVVHVVATDAAGNSSAATITLKIDRTPPSISATVTPSPNAAGWNSSNVIVSFICTDAESGIATCPAPVPVITEGASQSVTGTAIDNAGNTAQASVVVKLDKTPPVITATSTPLANAAGWNTSDVTVTYACSDGLSGVLACPSPNVVSTEGKAQQITATVSDQAGNSATTTVQLNIEKTAPSIAALLSPLANAAGWNNTDVTVSFSCTPSASDIVSCPPPVTVTTEGKAQNVSGSVTDQAGKSATTAAIVNIDKTPPLISASAAPPANAAGWNNSDVVVSYVCSDSLSGIGICPAPATVSSEGAAQKIAAQATDQAGNTAFASTTLSIDKTPPSVTATAAPPANGAGWNNTNVTVTYSCNDTLSGVANCPSSALVSSEGQNQNISAQATDVAGNVATGSVTLSIDKTPPSIVQLSTPDHISRLHGGQIDVTVNDNFSVAQVVISVNGVSLGAFSSAPYQAALQVPAGANPGDTLTVTAQATDEAGNTQTSSRAVRVAADGVIVGQVLSDADSFPIPAASVQAIAKTTLTDQTDDHGRYSLQVSDSHVFVTATSASPATTTVEREVFVQEGVGTVPVDARLTPLSAPVAIGSAGGTVKAGTISITVPAGMVADGATVQLTPLSGQGLPGLLPLGWSPLSSFDLRASTSAANLAGAVTGLPNVPVHLIFYNPALHAWTMVSPNLQPVTGSLSFTVPALGDYALVVPDVVDPPIVVPNSGDALTGMDMQLLSSSAITSGSLSPAILPPSGGTATATLGLQSPAFVPSGTVIQANVSEKFSLTSGDVVSQESRTEDIVLYNSLAPADSVVGAQFPVKPSRKFANAELLTGKVHLDILAGREGVRGQPGGSNPLVLSDGTSTLSVPANALSEDTAISIESVALEDFIPVSSSLNALQEVIADFSGETLNTPAQLSISSTGLNPADVFLLTKVERVDGVPHIVVVALAQLNGNALTSVSSPGLPGVMEGGEYVFYDLTAASGFIQGMVSTSAGPIGAVVQTDSLPIVSITGADGRYLVPALTGSVNLKASVPHTALAGSAAVQVTAAQTTQANLVLAGTVTSAVLSPADGTLGVPVGTVITVTTTAPLNPQSIVQSNLVLLKGSASSGVPVAVQPFVLSSSGTVLSFAPQKNLDPATQYTVQISGLADTFGGAVVVPSATFTTKAVAALTFDPNAITFSFPDANGNIHVSAPAGSLPPGTRVLIIDQTSGLVLSLTSLNDGSVSGDFLGTINDLLQITVTDPTGATLSFTKSQYVAADGTVAVGPGGGTVTGPGGVELRIPDGALDKGATFKIEAFGPERFPERPDLPGGTFGGGLKITSSEQPTFKKEVRLAFPKPADAPDGAFFQVYRRLEGPNNQVAFEDLDYAKVEGQGSTAKVVTASFPYRGLIDFNALIAQAAYQGQVLGGPLGGNAVTGALENNAILTWTFDNALPGISLGGAITGHVRYAVPPGGMLPDGTVNKTGDNVFAGVPNVTVTVDTNTSTHSLGTGVTVATTQPDGTFTFSDPNYKGGTINLVATDGSGHAATAGATEVVSLTDKTVNDFAGPLLKFYRNVAFADMVVPAPVPTGPQPLIGISVFREVADTNPDTSGPQPPPPIRQDPGAVIVDGTPLVIAFKTNGSIAQAPNVTINGIPYPTQQDIPAKRTDPNKLDFELAQSFTSNGPGIYKVVATGLTPFLQTVTASKSFLVVGAGGDNNAIRVGAPPEIISTSPATDALAVPVNTFVQVTFSEPVKNIPGNVSLVPDDGSGSPDLKLSGIDYKTGIPIASIANTDAVSSLTLQPVEGLKYGTHYTLKLSSAIVDLDNVQDPTKVALPLKQPDSPIGFTTFGPEILGGTSAFSSTRAVVVGNRAYIATVLNSSISAVNTYDISDPTNPVQIPTSTTSFVGRAQDIAGEENAPVINGGNLIAVGAAVGATDFGLPSNLWLYDVGGDQVHRVGAVSVTGSTVNEGQILRVTVNGDFAYTSTFPVGIEVVDLQQAITEYNSVFNNNPIQFGQQITTDGEGFARDAVVGTIPVKDTNGRNVMLLGIQAGQFSVAGSDSQNPTTQTLVTATGVVPGAIPNPISFVVADPSSPGPPMYSGPLQLANFSVDSGTALTLGQLTDSRPDQNGNLPTKSIAVVVGRGAGLDPKNPGQAIAGGVLAVVDLSIPSAPVVLSILKLDAFPTDVLLRDSTALVGTGQNEVLLVSLQDPRNPRSAGAIHNPIFGDRLALTPDGILLGTSFDGNRGGIQIATVGAIALITKISPHINLDVNGMTTAPIEVEYLFAGAPTTLKTGKLDLIEDGDVVATVNVPDVSPGRHTLTIPPGVVFDPSPKTLEISVVRADGSTTSPYVTTVEPLDTDSPDDFVTSNISVLSAVSSPVSRLASLGLGMAFTPIQTSAAGTPDTLIGVNSADGVTPSQVPVGTGDTVVTTNFIGVSSLPTISLRGLDGNWTAFNTTSVTDDVFTISIPANYFSLPGFLEISPTGNDSNATVIAVVDTTLPALGTAADIVPANVIESTDKNSGNQIISIFGSGFAQGMEIVFGLGTTPVASLPTTFNTDGSLQATLPPWEVVANPDVFVAVLSPDGRRLSTPLRLPASQSIDELEKADIPDLDFPINAAAAFNEGDIELTGAIRNPSSSTPGAGPLSEIGLQGVGLTNGATVQFKLVKGNTSTILTSTLTNVGDDPSLASLEVPPSGGVGLGAPIFQTPAPTSKPPLKHGTATVPPKAQKQGTRVAQIRGLAADGQVLAQSVPSGFHAGALVVPFGGRIKVGVYKNSKDAKADPKILTKSEHDTLPDAGDWMLQSDVMPVFENQDSDRDLAQVEIEPLDKGFEHLRGLSLSQIPGEAIIRPNGHLLVNNTSLRDVYVLYVNLGTAITQNDQELARAANKHGIPPQYLKSQAIQESVHFSANFRYEPSTIDFNMLSGDPASGAINSSPFKFYTVQGTNLPSLPPVINLSPFAFDSNNAAKTQFQIGQGPLKRRNKAVASSQMWKSSQRLELQPAIRAQIEQQGKPPLPLQLIRRTTVWRKVGTSKAGFSSGAVEPAPSPALQTNEFNMDYDAGILTLGAPLTPGQSLHVTMFWPLQNVARPVPAGRFVAAGAAPDLNSGAIKQLSHLLYDTAHQQSMFDFFKTNIANDSRGSFLSGTTSDKQIEFKVGSNGLTPTEPYDPKYKFATAQPYASSSYGVLQLTLLAWGGGTTGPILDSIFNVRFENGQNFHSIFDLLVQKDANGKTTDQNGVDLALKQGLDLGAAYSEAIFKRTQQSGRLLCSATNCNEASWEKQWAKIFNSYNSADAFYKLGGDGLNVLVHNGNGYVPK